MSLTATAEVEAVGDQYQRIYIPARLSSDSQYPFEAGDGVRLQVAKTTCDREVLVVTSDLLEVDGEAGEIEVNVAEQRQVSLTEAGDD